ncbi:hypothetical protein VNO80_03934 [Phaseolus coccineus]|uniref:Uncharacterized protein n=1 Tax=Phaseolus coccineus TaxID=3886 RepID=A0AAN9NT95_PHACN
MRFRSLYLSVSENSCLLAYASTFSPKRTPLTVTVPSTVEKKEKNSAMAVTVSVPSHSSTLCFSFSINERQFLFLFFLSVDNNLCNDSRVLSRLIDVG